MVEPLLAERDWVGILKELHEADTWRVAVLDELIVKDRLSTIREELLQHWGWRYKDWEHSHLRLAVPNTRLVRQLGGELAAALRVGGDDREVLDHWALMQHKPQGQGEPHWDRYGLTMSIWLTPDGFNEDPDSGGLLVYDVSHDESDRATWGPDKLRDLIRQRSRGRHLRIPYRCNRAILLDSRWLHRTDSFTWAVDKTVPESARLNLSYSFVTRDEYRRYHETIQAELQDVDS